MGGVFNAINLHLYHYAGIGQRSDSELQANNPVKYNDPTGEWFHFAIGAILGGVVNATISAYDQYKENGKVDFSTAAIA